MIVCLLVSRADWTLLVVVPSSAIHDVRGVNTIHDVQDVTLFMMCKVCCCS